MRGFTDTLRRELRLALRQGGVSLLVVMFFVLVVVLFPLGAGPEPGILSRIGAGIIWVSALLAAMLSMDRLYQSDFEDGSLELLVLSPAPLEIIVLAKAAAHWLTTGLPLIVASPLLGLLLNLEAEGMAVMLVSLTLGTPALSLVGAIAAALVLGARRGGVLISLLILPLFVPILIFGVGAVDAALLELTYRPQLMVLGALLLLAAALSPWAAAAAVRQAVA